MPVSCIIPAPPRLRKAPRRLLLAILLTFVTNCGLAKGPDPAQSIPLEPLGFQKPLTQFLLAGSSMVTVDFVDPKHLLLTFSAKRLLKRLPDCPPGDQDRVVDAVMLELPSGKVIARTSWRTHDHGQYLWNLSRGRFLLRIRDDLWTFAPMVNLQKADAFRLSPFIRSDRRIGAILLSPDADLMILETMERQHGDQIDPKPQENPVQINFFRLIDRGGDQIDLQQGGALRSRTAGRIPANSAGYIAILDQGQQRWGFDFRSYGGKVKELAAFDSTCRPSPVLVSRSEFIAFGCHLSHTPQVVGAFNLRGEEMWEQNMTERYVAPTFSYAPSGGRFALSRVLTRAMLMDEDSVVPEMFDGQNVTVYQTDSGRQLLRVDAAPIARAGQNFALSPDGLNLAVIQNDALSIFRLPPLTSKEREAVQMAEASAPQIDGEPSVTLTSDGGGSTTSSSAPETAIPPIAATAPAAAPAPSNGVDTAAASSGSVAPAPAAAEQPADGASSTNAAGTAGAEKESSAQKRDAEPSAAEGDSPQRRAPPTLYAPGEKHESGDAGKNQGREAPQETPR